MDDGSKTFVFLTTPPGRGGIAVIALAGPDAVEIVRKVFRPWKSHLNDRPGVLRLGHIVDGERILDEVVLCRISGDSKTRDSHHISRQEDSRTGESPAVLYEFYEINIHGGPLVARETMDLLQRNGAAGFAPKDRGRDARDTLFSPAHPRWNNPAIGREMLAALPQAQSELVVTALTQQWSGGISELAREALLSSNPKSQIRNPKLAATLHHASECLTPFQKLLDPCNVVVLGPPNVGKSTLVNALAGRSVSIVHEQPGTTRDWVREPALIRGAPICLTDTAGLWEDSSELDAQAMRRAREQALGADLVLLCEAAAPCVSTGNTIPSGPPDWLHGKHVLHLTTKCDRVACLPPGVAVSAHTGQGLDELKDAILCALGLADIDPSAPMAFTRRQADLLAGAAKNPDRAADLLRQLLGE